jgi:polar amino acid transport system substrate-binding protein
MTRNRLVAAVISIMLMMTVIAGCSNSDSNDTTTTVDSAPGAIAPDPAAVALLPADIKDSGVLEIGIELSYPPDEYKDPEGNPTGWGVELVTAIAEKLGLTPNFRESQFDNIIPSVKGGTYDVGWASFTDTKERQNSVDFVDYYTAGGQWASQTGNPVDPNNACGLTVAVGTGTYQETDEIPARSEACVAEGKEPINKLKLDTQGDITTAVVLGRADAMTADSPVTQYAVSQTDGKLALAGEIFDAAPFGAAINKDAGTLKDAIAAALQSLIDDGTYMEILQKWGVESGAVDSVVINGGTS